MSTDIIKPAEVIWHDGHVQANERNRSAEGGLIPAIQLALTNTPEALFAVLVGSRAKESQNNNMN